MSFLSVKYKKAEKGAGVVRVVVSKKVSKKATTRNKIRRQIKAIIQTHVKKYKGTDITIFTKPEIINKKFSDIKKEIETLLKK